MTDQHRPAWGPDTGAGWADQDPQDVRPYAVTAGRTQARYVLRLESLLTAGSPGDAAALTPEAAQMVDVCRSHRHCSVAELAARIGQPVQVTKILICDLIDCGALVRAAPDSLSGGSMQEALEAAVAGLEARFHGVA